MKFDLEAIKKIPITDVLSYVGYTCSRSGKWLSVKGDRSFKVDIKSNTYYDFSKKLGHGSTIDLIMNTQGVDFTRACEILTNHFLGGVPINFSPKNPEKKINTVMSKKYIDKNIASALLDAKHYARNNLFKFLLKKWDVTAETMRSFGVGTTKDGHAAFLYQNVDGQYEFVKVVPYNSETGKRESNIIVPKGFQTQDGYTAQCFFNEVAAKDAEIIFIVESEKTAIIATLYFKQPKFAFLATGGAQKLASLLRAKAPLLASKKVVLLPDNDDAGATWITTAKEFEDIYETIQAWILDLDAPDKSDLADFILGESKNWQETFKRLYNKLNPPKLQQKFTIQKAALQSEPNPQSEFENNKELADFRQRFDLQKKQPTESEIYWKNRDAEKTAKIDTSTFEELKRFFDKQVLPDVLMFHNSDGLVYETIKEPNLYIVQQIANVEMLISEGRHYQANIAIYHLQRVKDLLQKGGYMLSKKVDEVPF